MRFPVRPLVGSWPSVFEARLGRFFRPDPRRVLDPGATGPEYTAAMSAMHVGSTIKITERHRHPEADRALLEHLPADPYVVDLGASDGSTSLDLIEALPAFRRYVVADLFLEVTATRVGRRVVFRDGTGQVVVVAGPLVAAWPQDSPVVARLYARVLRRSLEQREHVDVLLLNPQLQDLMARDPRVERRTHDVFTPWPAPAPDVFKVANLLRRIYFDDDQILEALAALHSSLDDGGLLFLVDDGQRYLSDDSRPVGARYGIYRRGSTGFDLVARSDAPPEIADLVAQPLRSRP